MADTRAQDTVHSPQSDYAASVAATPDDDLAKHPQVKAARAAIKTVDTAQDRLSRARRDRDAAVAAAAASGIKAPVLARVIGMSTSNVRLAIERAER